MTRGISDSTAINVALLPDATMRARAQAMNRRLRENYPEGFALDESRVVHITLVQAYVHRADLEAIWERVAAIEPGGSLRAESFDFFARNGLGSSGFDLNLPPWLQQAHDKAVAAVVPFALEEGDEAAFVTTPQESTIADSSIEYVKGFFSEHSGDRYRPHVTLGRAHRKFLESVRAEPFDAFAFQVEELVIYQLGNHGTCRKRLYGKAL